MSHKETVFVSPETGERLYELTGNGENYLATLSGLKYAYTNSGFPDLVYPKVLEERVKYHHDFFEKLADVYDKYMPQTFKTHNEDEIKARSQFIDLLHLKSNSKVLEVACGTGRDSELIAKRLNKEGQFNLIDISSNMLNVCKKKLETTEVEKFFCLSNAEHLPFPDKYFDAVYSFTAMQYFDIKKSLSEMARVTKVGGKIVIGDHSMPPWLRDTYYGKVLATNSGVLAELPLREIPVCARKVTVRWVLGDIFYLIDFEVGEGEPVGDFDYEIEGQRGGTLRTRYEGQLEGVNPATRQLAIKAAKAKGMSLHKWLDSLVNEAAKKQLQAD